MIILSLVFLAILVAAALAFFLRTRTGTGSALWLGSLLITLLPGSILFYATRDPENLQAYGLWLVGAALFLLGLAASLLVFGIVEFLILRLGEMSVIGAIARVTYYESLLQPFTLIILALAVAMIIILGFVPFFTLSEDSKMYRDVATSFAFLFVLPIMIFASSKVIDEEIENRTMLTLMSKPVSRLQVILGKYAGVTLLVFVCTLSLGIMAGVCAYTRYFDDQRLDYAVASTKQTIEHLNYVNHKTIIALIPANILQFMQLATLAAVSVAISTRFGLAMNITVIVLMYIISNLTRYIGNLQLPDPWEGVATFFARFLPSLGMLDLNQRLIYGDYNLGDEFVQGLPHLNDIWLYVGQSGIYSALYIGAALCLAVILFRNRELV